jgi:5-methylcytosine-specific restriction endonuclease McrA
VFDRAARERETRELISEFLDAPIWTAGVVDSLTTALEWACRLMPYDEYLKTSHWQLKKMEAERAAGEECALCGSAKNLNVHHKRYDKLSWEWLSDLTVLCRTCHAKHHEKF